MNPFQIVLVEDNPGDVFLIDLALKEISIPCKLTQFNSGLEVLKALSTDGLFVPDAILLDLNTPKSDGFEVLRQLRCFLGLAQVPIAILTSSAARKDKERAGLENVRFIQKPSQLAEFLSTVGQAVQEMLHQ